MNIKTLIVDDEKHCRNLIKDLLNKHFPEIEIVYQVNSVKEARKSIRNSNIDLIFTDIQMPHEDGFQLLQSPEFNKLDSVGVIFITAYDQYAIKALRFAAIDYLLKPIDEREFVEAVERFRKMIKEKDPYKENIKFLKSLNNQSGYNKICLPSKKGMIFTEIDDILYFEAKGSYTIVHILNRKNVLVSKPIINFEKLLDDISFVRVHRSYLVNLNHIKEYNSNENYLQLSDKSIVEVSVRKRQALTKMMSIYLHP